MISLIVGTRGSKLALRQAELLGQVIEEHSPVTKVELKIIKTRGDVPLERPSTGVSEKSLFTKELEDELLAGQIDVAVHSGKDLSSRTPAGLALGAVLTRGDRADAFCSVKYDRFDELPKSATVGTNSIRRRAQILLRRPDIQVLPLRGNVDTRLRKLKDGAYDAVVLASCGLERLNLDGAIRERFDSKTFLPAPAQAAIAIQYRSDRTEVGNMLKAISDETSFCEVKAERALLERLEAGCWVPLGASAVVKAETLTLRAGLFSPNGERSVVRRMEGSAKDPVALGWQMAKELLRNGGQQILDELHDYFKSSGNA